jgi:hypothetical protein
MNQYMSTSVQQQDISTSTHQYINIASVHRSNIKHLDISKSVHQYISTSSTSACRSTSVRSRSRLHRIHQYNSNAVHQYKEVLISTSVHHINSTSVHQPHAHHTTGAPGRSHSTRASTLMAQTHWCHVTIQRILSWKHWPGAQTSILPAFVCSLPLLASRAIIQLGLRHNQATTWRSPALLQFTSLVARTRRPVGRYARHVLCTIIYLRLMCMRPSCTPSR